VELEDELEEKNRMLADHARHVAQMVSALPPTPAGMKGKPSQFHDADAGDFSAPGLPIGGLLAASSPDGAAAASTQAIRSCLRFIGTFMTDCL